MMKLAKNSLKFILILLIISVFVTCTSIAVYGSRKIDQCQFNYNFKNFNTLSIRFNPPCLNEMFKVDQRLSSGEETIKKQTNNQVILKNLTYSVIDEGIKFQGYVRLEAPVIGTIETNFEQDMLLSVRDGILQIKAGNNNFTNSNVPLNLISPLISNEIEKQLSPYNGKTLEELLVTYGDDKLFTFLNLNKNFFFNTMNRIKLKVTTEQLNLDIPFRK